MARELKHDSKEACEGEENPGERGAERERRPGRNPFLGRILLIAGIATAPAAAQLGCDTAPPIVEDADAETHQDVEDEADVSAEDFPQPDAEADSEGIIDVTDDLVPEADVEPDSDALDVGPDSDSDMEEVEGGDDGSAPDCTAGATRIEEEVVPGPDRICNELYEEGSSQEITKEWEVTEWIGPDCPESETWRLLSYRIRIDPPISETGLACAGSDMLGMPDGDEVIVSVSIGGIVTADRIGHATLREAERKDWGSGEYKSMIGSAPRASRVRISTFDATNYFLESVYVYQNGGHSPLPAVDGMEPRAYLVDEIEEVSEYAHVTYIATPVRDRAEGSTVTYMGEIYTIYMDISDGEWHGIIIE